jgi:hypothetical protein
MLYNMQRYALSSKSYKLTYNIYALDTTTSSNNISYNNILGKNTLSSRTTVSKE